MGDVTVRHGGSVRVNAVHFVGPQTLKLGKGNDGGGVLEFPSRRAYRHVEADEAGALVRGEMDALRYRQLKESHQFVVDCAHVARDARCGTCGPQLVEAFEAAVAERELHNIHVLASSHVGGHSYAGNVLLIGDDGVPRWHGYCSREDVDE